METSSSIIQEYYKIQDSWKEATREKDKRLFIWLSEYQNVEIIHCFLNIERSPAGSCEDIFFQFDTQYTGDNILYEEGLWQEFNNWFTVEDARIDMFGAMKEEGLLDKNYEPDFSLKPTAQNLWKELVRLKNSMVGYSDKNFCLYIPPVLPNHPQLTDWFSLVLKEGIPKGIRLVTIDYKENQQIKIRTSPKVTIIEPKLDMINAINNDINRQSDAKNTVSPEDRLRRQIKLVLDMGAKKEKSSLEKEVNTLISISEEINKPVVKLSALLIASQGYFFVQDEEQAEKFINEAITKADEALKSDDQEIYALWKSILLFNGAIILKKRKHHDAMQVYQKLTDEALKRKDVYYIMEGHRLIGHLYYELGETNKAFETSLLSLYAGSYLDPQVRRQSTYLQAASLAVFLGEKNRSLDDMAILEENLKEWIGDDWKSLVNTREMQQAKVKNKAPLLERLK